MMQTKKLLATALTALLTMPLPTIVATPLGAQTRQVMIYSPGERDGLHIAVQGDDGSWADRGQLCASDYGQWGAEKRMYHPSLCRATDGTWRLVFQLNDRAPAFAAAYSPDLVTWRPQDYPRMTTRQCLQPVVAQNADGTFTVYYKTKGGDKRQATATADFRHFSADVASTAPNGLWQRDTATIGGQLHEGNRFELTEEEWARVDSHFAWLADDARKSGERMHDDPQRDFSTLTGADGTARATLVVDPTGEKAISDQLIGVFFEDISYAADGGLYAELIQNRDFEYSPKDHQGWNATTAWTSNRPIRVVAVDPLSDNNPHYAVISNDTLYNEGWDGIAIEAGKKYDFSMFVQGTGGKKTFVVQLVGADGTVLAQATLKTKGEGWRQYATTLTAQKSDAKARLALIGLKDATAGVDMVSLFPQDTFKGRKNGLRRDLAQAIADLHPKFVRFPGGCMSHGQGLDNIYHWQHTIGPLWERKPDFNIWHYHQTRGLGFYEYFQFCEDIGAEPLPVLAAGVPCQNSAANSQGFGGQQGGIPMSEMQDYIQELLNLIEWANGDPATSEWARRRAEAGHPAPFHLKYIGIGNEDIISTVFEERYEMIARAIREQYPDIKICGTVGPFHYPSADYTEGWDFTRQHPDLQYMVDEHYYESTGWFMHHRDYYDRYDRTLPKVYLGEWAASTKDRRPNVETALAEALYLTDIERNGDVVEMTSYAPLFCKDGHSNWNPDMIYFSNTEVRPTPAYEVQRLFSATSGNRYVPSRLSIADAQWSHRVGASVVKDTATGRTYVKLVNALPVALSITVEGLQIPATARMEGFEGKPEEQKVSSHASEVGNQLVLPPYSLRFITIP